MPRRATVADVISEVDRLSRAFPSRSVFVGIDGFGGSGKSTLAAAVVAALPNVVLIHVDDFWGPGIREWDWDRFRSQVLVPLLDAGPARYQAWDWDHDRPGDWRDVAPGQVLVVEGVSSTRAEVGVPWDLTMWVDAPRDVRLARALERDGEPMLGRWLDDWMPSEEAYAAREEPQNRVDLIVSGEPSS